MPKVPELNAPHVPIKYRKTRMDLRGKNPSRKREAQAYMAQRSNVPLGSGDGTTNLAGPQPVFQVRSSPAAPRRHDY